VDQSRKATKPRRTSTVTFRARLVMREEPPGGPRCSPGHTGAWYGLGSSKGMTRMECSEITACLWEYLDGELAAKEAEAVDGHLEGCSWCRGHQRCDLAFLMLLRRALKRRR
jgi:hypothetical protein